MLTRRGVDDRLCFVMMPYDTAFNKCYATVRAAVSSVGLSALRADEIADPNSIQKNIWDSIWKAKLALADVSGLNPNVNYELGMCHALQVPVVIIARKGTKVPVDYGHIRFIAYDPRQPKWERGLHAEIVLAARAILDGRYQAPFEWPRALLPAGLFRKSNDSALPELLAFIAKNPIQRAIVIQYSGINNMSVIKALWATDADVEVYVAEEDGRYRLSDWQAGRVRQFVAGLRNELANIAGRGSRGKLEVFHYAAPGSVRAVLLDDALLTFGAYQYEKRDLTGAGKELDVRGSEMPLALVRGGDPDFETLRFRIAGMIQNWKDEGVVKRGLVLERGCREGMFS